MVNAPTIHAQAAPAAVATATARRVSIILLLGLLLGLLLSAAGCQDRMRMAPTHLIEQGEHAQAREQVMRHMTHDPSKRQYLLDRMRIGVLAMADGQPRAADVVFGEVFDVLRTLGINEDRTVAAAVFHEGVKFWKGEPFEQALALWYISAQQAMLGRWDNARAAAGNSLFRLHDFGRDPATGQRIDTAAIARRAAEIERARREGREVGPYDDGDDFLNTGYAVVESNFTLGYITHALASYQLGRDREGEDYLAAAAEIDPHIRPLLRELRDGDYNTVLMVGYGMGPRKVAYGPGNALARFDPRTASDGRPLLAAVRDQGGQPIADRRVAVPVVADVNRMAADHRWNNLEDVRLAKNAVGDLLIVGGATAAVIGADHGSDVAVFAGLGAMALGAMAKAGSHADTRFCDVMPQRLYVVPVKIDQPGQTVELQVQGLPGSRLILTGLMPPANGALQLRYVKLNSGRGSPPQWAVSGRIYYSNDITGAVPGPQWPWLLGGNDVRLPTPRAVEDYHRDGMTRDVTYVELENAYRAEGLRLAVEDGTGLPPGRHVLEGGDSLIPPMGGTTGFVRLFGQVHPPYRIQGAELRRLERRLIPPDRSEPPAVHRSR